MSQVVVLRLGIGDLQSGFPAVTVQLGCDRHPTQMQIFGSLPGAPELRELYRNWQLLYEALSYRLRGRMIIEDDVEPLQVSEAEFGELCQRLETCLNAWLNSEPFRPIDQRLRAKLNPDENVRVMIETEDDLLRRLPWHLWNFLEDYPKAEVALSAREYQINTLSRTATGKVKILAILGNSAGIDLQKDRELIQELRTHNGVPTFLLEPSRRELDERLWDEKGWDILFFAGHSLSQQEGETGRIYLNQTDSLTIPQLKNALKAAIARGLRLAIFNSCDGLGLARQLEDLHIPQIIVMREPVPDAVAQEFLRHFLAAFSRGESLYTSVREAREKLQKLEGDFPCASWLPAICQNPAVVSTTWDQWCGETQQVYPPSFSIWNRLSTVILMSVVTTATLMGVRHLGMLQTLELKAFDQILRLRPYEGPDPRLLVVTVTEADIQAQNSKQRKGSLSDRSLMQLLEKLEPYQPRAIGLDIYHDFPFDPNDADLATRLRRNDRFLTVCQVSDPDDNNPGVPPPPEIPAKRLGFSDVVLDPDGIIRRHLLALTPPPASACTASYSLSVQLAFRYLETKGILPNYTKEGNLQLGSVIFKQIDAHYGGYQGVDAWGHQVLLNYRSHRWNQEIAPQVTLTQVLTGQLNPNVVKDRIVLIGITAKSVHDYWSTPYSAGTTPGVFVQAQMVSQILSAVLDNRPLLWVLPLWGEMLWVWGWALVGGLLAWRFGESLYLGLVALAALSILSGLSYGLLLQGGWVPLVPGAIALVTTGGSVAAILVGKSQR